MIFLTLVIFFFFLTIIIIAVVRGEGFSYSFGYRDTLNIFWGSFLSFLRKRIFGPLLLVGCRYYNIFLGGALSFLRACTFLAPLVFISLFLLSLFLLFTLLLLVVLFASASETNRCSFTEFLLQQRGKGRVSTRGRGRGNSKLRGDKS